MKRTARGALLAILALVVSFGLGSATSAQAGNLYLYADPNYKALIGTYATTNGTYHNISAVNNDTLSSVQNGTSYYVAFAHDYNLSGHCFTEPPNTNDPAFWWFDDNQVSSFWINRSC